MCDKPEFNLILISSLSGVFVFVLLTILAAYHNRWKIRYLHKVQLAKWFGFHPRHQESRYKFDAYILYAEEDRDFVIGTMLEELEQMPPTLVAPGCS